MTLPQSKPPATFRKHVLSLIGESYGDKTLVLCPTVFVKLLNGDHKAAILLSQILYWGDRTKDPDGWFYKSYADWHAETGLSAAQVRRILNGDPRVKSLQVTLRDLGVETVLKKVKYTGAPTLHYRIDQARFLAVLHTLLGQSDSQQCARSMVNTEQNEPPTLTGMNHPQCAPSSLDPETTTPETSAEDQPSQNPDQTDEDPDLRIFLSFEGRFGKLKEQKLGTFRTELARLGAPKVREVLERCATRGRSWSYVAKALANETAAPGLQDMGVETRWGGWPAVDSENGQLRQAEPEPTPVAVSERLQTPWQSFGGRQGTVQEAWMAAFHQLELQLDRASFDRFLRDAILVDFDPEAPTFVVVARNSHVRDMLQYRLDRLVKRVAGDVYGQPVEVQFVLSEEWIEQGEHIA